MRAWLGEPEDLQDPELETIRGRALASKRLHAAFERLFCERDKDELTLEGQARGVPIAPVLTPADVLAAEHFRARGAIARTELARGIAAAAPRASPRSTVGGCGPVAAPRRSASTTTRCSPRRRRSAGGVGGERRSACVGRWTACACWTSASSCSAPRPPACSATRAPRSIKIESRAFPDGARISPVHFAIGHRGSKGLGVNLRSPEGVDVVEAAGRAVRRGAGQLQAGHAGQAGARRAGAAGDQPRDRRGQQQRRRSDRPVERVDGLRPLVGAPPG